MSICVMMTRAPLNGQKLREELAHHHAVEVSLIEDVDLDEKERNGLAQLMREVQTEYCLCLVDPAAPAYETGLFDSASETRTRVLKAAARESLDQEATVAIVLMLEWDGFDSTCVFDGGLEDFTAFIAINGSWPTFRYIGKRSQLQEDPYRAMVFRLSR